MQNNFFRSETTVSKRTNVSRSTSASRDIYNEIMNIAKEIERCRASI